MLKGNKGEWSEFYVLLYLLGTRKLYAADEKLDKIAGFYFPIKKIIRNDTPSKPINFVLEGVDKVEIYLNTKLSRTMTSKEFEKEAKSLYDKICKGKNTFNIPGSENLLKDMELERLTAPSTEVTDIKMEVSDTTTGIDQIMGFSIKSYIGGSPTLLNASGATNFVYEVLNLTDTQMKDVNSINTRTKILDRINKIKEYGGKIKYCKMSNDVFSGNLSMIDSRMEDVLSVLLLHSYEENELDCKNNIDYLKTTNPLECRRIDFYEHKFKDFLCAKALGLEPSIKWMGEDNSNGGYIVVKSDGDVLAYHLYNRDKFRQYLLDNTKLERASTTRHKYATIYKEDDKMYINLNLQIRFK